MLSRLMSEIHSVTTIPTRSDAAALRIERLRAHSVDDHSCMRAAFLAGASFVRDEIRVNADYQLRGEPDWSTIEAAAVAHVTLTQDTVAPQFDDEARSVVATISDWCWLRYRLPCRPSNDSSWTYPPSGPTLGAAIADALRAVDGVHPHAYPGIAPPASSAEYSARDSLLLLAGPCSPLVASERSAVRALISAADAAVGSGSGSRTTSQE